MPLGLLCSFILLLWGASAAAAAEGPVLSARAGVLLEAHSGVLLLSQNGAEPLPPASTGKILTALLALDLAPDLAQVYTVSPTAAAVGESSADLRAGETLTMGELLRGALVHSGNDACFAIGEAVAGSEPLFVHWLNMKAAAMGAYSARLCNTNGLPAPEHRISAADLGMIAAAAMEKPDFAAIVGSRFTSLGQGENYRVFRNTNKLLWQEEQIIGVKTGTTEEAGPCLVAACASGPALFISVVLNSPDRYGESLALLHFGRDNFVLLDLVRAGQALAYANDRLWRAETDLQVLVKREVLRGLSLRWLLPGDDGDCRMQLLDGEGKVLGEVRLC